MHLQCNGLIRNCPPMHDAIKVKLQLNGHEDKRRQGRSLHNGT